MLRLKGDRVYQQAQVDVISPKYVCRSIIEMDSRMRDHEFEPNDRAFKLHRLLIVTTIKVASSSSALPILGKA